MTPRERADQGPNGSADADADRSAGRGTGEGTSGSGAPPEPAGQDAGQYQGQNAGQNAGQDAGRDAGRGAPRGGRAAARGTRRAYHHGDLRNALVEAGMELVRSGGPDALVLREVARATGVSSTAAYRHFENHGDLVEAVKHQASLLMARAVRAELGAKPPSSDPADEALRRIAAAGAGYVRFALAEPGLFRLIFRENRNGGRTALSLAAEEAPPAKEGDESYMTMADALDTLVAEGVLAPERRPFMDIALWGSVHGIAMLLIDTNLADLPEEAREAAIQRSFDVAFHGIVPAGRVGGEISSPYA
ncbi:TetR/AcrR family transcriptional regulator [Yinghuangia sp. YIM S09857]|uniref:TetR/AcrR family transcriptional regulator n=1 Tax=Yinghuangia sp. YIM S09857 TaxID=3436929 RepID=UPI003F52F1FE